VREAPFSFDQKLKIILELLV